jgi:hypothetical protein
VISDRVFHYISLFSAPVKRGGGMGAPGRARRLLLVNLLLSAGGGGLAWVLPSRPGAALLPLPPRLPWSSGGGRCVHGRLEPRYQRTERSIRMNAEETKGLLRSIEDFFGLPTPEERRKAQARPSRKEPDPQSEASCSRPRDQAGRDDAASRGAASITTGCGQNCTADQVTSHCSRCALRICTRRLSWIEQPSGCCCCCNSGALQRT